MRPLQYVARLAAMAMVAGASSAQQTDFVGIMVSTFDPTGSGTTVRSLCGDTFNCTPLQLFGNRGDDLAVTLLGTRNDPYVVLAAPISGPLQCVTLPFPNLVNSILVPQGGLVTLAFGVMTEPDNGRCNGGSVQFNPLFRIPTVLQPGAFAIQGIAGAPTSGGGTGLAFSRAVSVTIR